MTLTKTSLRRPTRIAVALTFAALAVLCGHRVYEYAAPPEEAVEPVDAGPIAAEGSLPGLRHRGGRLDDASHLDATRVYGLVRATSEDQIREALRFAREHRLKVSCAGRRHSMGGQSLATDGLVLDLDGFDRLELDESRRTVRAQAGATWASLQRLLDRHGLSVAAMQSINIFSIGGTLSVNAHGIAHDPGPVAPTVRSMRVMRSDGRVETASPTENQELFRHVLGGYGLFGVILDAELDVVPNEVYALRSHVMDYRDLAAFYRERVAGNPRLGLVYGRVSISPTSYLTETVAHTYERTPFVGPVPFLPPPASATLPRLFFNLSKTSGLGRFTRWTLERRLGTALHGCLPGEPPKDGETVCLVTRNAEMSDDMAYLRNRLADTDILQEYFVPPEAAAAFVDGLRETVRADGTNLLNVTVRVVHRDTVTALPYARGDRLAFVLYFNQRRIEADSAVLGKTTNRLIDLATRLGGTFYLPYRLVYSREQLRRAYPTIDDFFATKRRLDPIDLFSNRFYETYGATFPARDGG